MTLVLIDTIMMLMDMMICYRKTITGGPGMLFHSELTWVPPGIVQGVPKKRTFRIIILQADPSRSLRGCLELASQACGLGLIVGPG